VRPQACLGGADAAPACTDDPDWTRDRRDSCDSYAVGQRNHAYCDDVGDDGRTAAAACALACGACPADDGPAARHRQVLASQGAGRSLRDNPNLSALEYA
jgi:hypothetical protein